MYNISRDPDTGLSVTYDLCRGPDNAGDAGQPRRARHRGVYLGALLMRSCVF